MATIGKYTLPDDLYYDRDSHLWLRCNGPTVTIGLDMLGQEAMGDMAYVGFEAPPRSVQRGEPIGSLEAAKMVAPIQAPISGRLIRINEAVLRNPRLINTSPYDKGWLVEMEPSAWETDVQDLIAGAAQVHAFLEAEVKRYQEQGWIVESLPA